MVWLICVSVCFSLGLSCMGLSMLPGLDWLFPFPCWEVFDYNLFKYFLRPFLFLFFFWDPYNLNAGAFNVVPGSLRLSSFLFILFSLFFSSTVISTILSSSSFICSSASVSLLLIPSGVFLKNIYLFILALPVLSCCMQDLHCSMWDLLVVACGFLSCGTWALSWGMHAGSSSLTRDWTQAPCIGSAECYPLDHQGSPPSSVFLISVIVLFIIVCLFFCSSRSLLNVSCIFSILFPIFGVIFTIITLNSFSGRLPISSLFIWSCGFLPCSLVCNMFLCIFILSDLLCLRSPFCRLQGHSSSCFWCLPPVGEVGSVACVDFLVGETGACILVGGAGSFPSDGQGCIRWCVLGCLWA